MRSLLLVVRCPSFVVCWCLVVGCWFCSLLVVRCSLFVFGFLFVGCWSLCAARCVLCFVL